MTKVEQKILEALSSGETLTRLDLVEKTGLSHAVVLRVAESMYRRGLIKAFAIRFYHLSDVDEFESEEK